MRLQKKKEHYGPKDNSKQFAFLDLNRPLTFARETTYPKVTMTIKKKEKRMEENKATGTKDQTGKEENRWFSTQKKINKKNFKKIIGLNIFNLITKEIDGRLSCFSNE